MPNYPTVYTFLTKNDMVVRVRSLRPEDAPYLVDLFENMSQESRYQRFLQTLEHVDMERVWTEAEQIAYGAAANSNGLIAFCDTAERPDVPVAAARYVRVDGDRAEVGISVRDDMHNLGIGSRLLGLLVEEARAEGLQEMIAYVQNSNLAIWRILRRLDYPLRYQPDGNASEIIIELGDCSNCEDVAIDFSPEPQLIG